MGSTCPSPLTGPLRPLMLLLLLCIAQLSAALKFDIPANPTNGKNERCIRNFVNKDQLVVVTAIVGGQKGDGQVVNMHVCSLCCSFLLLGVCGFSFPSKWMNKWAWAVLLCRPQPRRRIWIRQLELFIFLRSRTKDIAGPRYSIQLPVRIWLTVWLVWGNIDQRLNGKWLRQTQGRCWRETTGLYLRVGYRIRRVLWKYPCWTTYVTHFLPPYS